MVDSSQSDFVRLDLMSKEHKSALIAFNTISSLLTTITNAFLLYAIKKLKLDVNTSYRFITALTISELCLSTIGQPLYSLLYADVFPDEAFGEIMEIAAQFVGYVTCQFSGLMIFLISLDRYFHMKHLNLYNLHMTKRKGSFLLFCSVILSNLLAVLLTLAFLNGFFSYVYLGVIITNGVLFLLIIYNYINAYVSLKKRVAAMAASNDMPHNTSRADLRFAKGVLLIMASLAFRYMPLLVIGFLVSLKIDSINKKGQTVLPCAFLWSIHLVHLGAFIDAVLFFRFNSKLRCFASSKLPCNSSTEED